MRCCSSSTRSFCSRSEPADGRAAPRHRSVAGLIFRRALPFLLIALAGCGETGGEGTSAGAGVTPEPAGTLRIAVAGQVETLDPLLADDRAERIASRQVYEPLVSRQNGPFGQTRLRPGLVRSFDSNAAATIWTAQLRRAVRFQNGEPMDADAVIANVERWMNVTPGPELLPELAIPPADSPRPGLVRFFLNRPVRDFPRRLADARLGLVAPEAIAEAGSGPVKLGATGTGPFEPREGDPGTTLLARNLSWWGADLGLGPGVEQIELLQVDDPRDRADDLLDGSVEVADDLGRATAARLKRDPLATLVRGGGAVIGVERSVRGIESAEVGQPLADVWLTNLR